MELLEKLLLIGGSLIVGGAIVIVTQYFRKK